MKHHPVYCVLFMTVLTGCFFLGTSIPGMAGDSCLSSSESTRLTRWCLRIDNAPNMVRAFGLEIIYPAEAMRFTGAAQAGLLQKGFDFFGAREISPGRVRIGGIEPGGNYIQKNAAGLVAELCFTVINQEAAPAFRIIQLKDDMAGWALPSGDDSRPAALSLNRCP